MKSYILQTDDGLFLNKDWTWSAAADKNSLFHSRHRDEALNQLIEINSKDISIRARVVQCQTDNKGRPLLTAENRKAANQNSQSDAA